MSGWMYYPYKKCQDCDHFDWDESDRIVNSPSFDCSYWREDCPEKGTEENDEDAFV